jgi:hypothetical protein
VLLHDPLLVPIAQREPAPTSARNPYKGLQAFGEGDAADFFGREALVERLVQSLAAGQRLIALVGPSGSGKSSIEAAGLIPRIRAGDIAGSQRWRIAPVMAGPDPLGDVLAIVGRIGGAGTVTSEQRWPASALPSGDGDARLVLVIDHFEQLFTVTEESRRSEFLRVLAAQLGDADARLTVILTLRADYCDRPLQHPEFSEVFVPGVVHVLPMTAREIEAAVVEPAEQVGVVEPALRASRGGDVGAPRSLPLLQYALTELFERREGPVLTSDTPPSGARGVLSAARRPLPRPWVR